MNFWCNNSSINVNFRSNAGSILGRSDIKERKRINKQNTASIEIIDNNAGISPIGLIEPGKLLLASRKNNNNNRKIEDIKNNESNTLLLLLLIDKPINKEGAIDDKLCAKGIIIAQEIPLEFKDNIE